MSETEIQFPDESIRTAIDPRINRTINDIRREFELTREQNLYNDLPISGTIDHIDESEIVGTGMIMESGVVSILDYMPDQTIISENELEDTEIEQ